MVLNKIAGLEDAGSGVSLIQSGFPGIANATIKTLNASTGVVVTNENYDVWIGLNVQPYSQEYIDGSLGERDVSITNLRNEDIRLDGSIANLYSTKQDISTLGTISAYDYWNGTQAAYDVLTPDGSTIYFINE